MPAGAIIAIIGGILGIAASIIAPIIKLNTSIVTLTVQMTGFSGGLKELTDDNKDSHARMWKHNDEQDATIANHETRITLIEKTKGN